MISMKNIEYLLNVNVRRKNKKHDAVWFEKFTHLRCEFFNKSKIVSALPCHIADIFWFIGIVGRVEDNVIKRRSCPVKILKKVTFERNNVSVEFVFYSILLNSPDRCRIDVDTGYLCPVCGRNQ